MYISLFVLPQNTALLGAQGGSSDSLALFGQVVFTVIVFIFVVLLAYYATKLLASAKILKSGGNNVRLIERVAVSQTNSVQLIKVGEKYFLIGVAKDHVSFLAEVNKEDIMTNENEPFEAKNPFQSIFNQIMGKKED